MLKTYDISVAGYERVVRGVNETTGLNAIIAIHNTRLGPALGGIRFKEYGSPEAQCVDALRLAEAMTLKNSSCGINKGGGKAAINAYGIAKTPELYESFGEMVEKLEGIYLAAGDVGTTTDDLFSVRETTNYVGGLEFDSSKYTAYGVLRAIEGWRETNGWLHRSELIVAISGLGKVGSKLLDCLASIDVKKLVIADIVPGLAQNYRDTYIRNGFETEIVVDSVDNIHKTPCHIFSPCALGGVINSETRSELNCNAVIGAANNQVDHLGTVGWLYQNGVDYITDYVTNAGGVIAIDNEISGDCHESTIIRDTLSIEHKVKNILALSREAGQPFDYLAQQMAWNRIDIGV